ncbi:hypothetical protein CERSUDRAFT_162781 [Gelatoporia subvermispora B]|uniref:Protein kinase domain-containing protein n=1 Tax=Ceriporiopsis subvermispora (strain B) TaxID=914234 RepID=M2P867_CERS8|nr:hypothetical protein CERSUDRAFT_162781 [Gelatoporia subvermispora B]
MAALIKPSNLVSCRASFSIPPRRVPLFAPTTKSCANSATLRPNMSTGYPPPFNHSNGAEYTDELKRIWSYLRAKTTRIRNDAQDSRMPGRPDVDNNSFALQDPGDIQKWVEMLDNLMISTTTIGSSLEARQWFASMFGLESINTQRVLHNQHPDDRVPLISAYLDMLRKLCKLHRTLPRSIILTPGMVTNTQSRPGQTPSAPAGSGGFGEVWKGLYRGMVVAIKVMRDRGENSSASLEMAFCEAIIWKYLDHPNITPFYGIERSGPRFSLVSQWMEHGTIRQYLQNYPDADRLELVVHIATGLKYLHDLGVVHGDLKTGNILINSEKVASLVDFGLAAICYDGQLDTQSVKEKTLRWTAPEIIDPETYGLSQVALTKESDVYSFAITIWEIYTNQIPFHNSRIDGTVMRSILSGQRPSRPEREASNGLDDDLWSLLQVCWSDQRSKRPSIRSVLYCMTRAPEGSYSKYRVQPNLLHHTVAQPPDVARSEWLAQPLSEWLASYVWRVCTTGYSLSPAYAAPGGFFTPQPTALAQCIAPVLSILPAPTAFLATWYLSRLPIYFGSVAYRHWSEQQFSDLLSRYISSHQDGKANAAFQAAVLGTMLAAEE